MSINFNVSPYYDDFDTEDKFYRILFRPGYAVQARELNQIQSIIQNQIDIHGKHIFKEGSMVIPGNSSVDTNAYYVKIANNAQVSGFVGKEIYGSISGVNALIIAARDSEHGDLPTIFVKYTSSGTDSVVKTFADGEDLLDKSNDVSILTAESISSNGIGSISSVEAGWYYIKNSFVYVGSQTIVLDKYSNTPSYKIGLEAREIIVTSAEQEQLLDNAQGSPNFAAPGADRYSIDLVLSKKNIDVAKAGTFIVGQQYTIVSLGTTDFTLIGARDNIVGDTFIATAVGSGTGTAIINEEDFIQLILVIDGRVIQKISNTEYSIIEQTLARRTFDESGDYTVRPFQIDVREYRNNFRGQWKQYTNYLAGDVVEVSVTGSTNYYVCRKDGTSNNVPPSVTVGSHTTGQTGVIWTFEKTPFYNRGVNNVKDTESVLEQNENKAKYAIGLEPGKAYVKGYEIEKTAISYIPLDKARDFSQQTNVKTPATVGNFILINNLHSAPNITTFETVELRSNLTATVGVAAGTQIGTARVRYIEFNSDTVANTSQTKYKLSLFDVKMNSGFNFNRDVKQIFSNRGSASKNFTADAFPVLSELSGSITTANTVVTGTRTLFNSELTVGDYISVEIAGSIHSRRVASITSNTLLHLDTQFSVTVTGQTFYRYQTTINEPELSSLLFMSTNPYIKSVRDSAGINRTSYTVATRFAQSSVVSGGASTVTISASGADTFASTSDADNYLLIDDTTGLAVTPTSIVGGGTQQVVFNIAVNQVRAYIVIAAINRTGASTEKSKTLNTETIDITLENRATARNVTLGKADGFRLLDVKMDSGTFAAPTGNYTIDISDRYNFDDGQRDTHYDLASIVLSTGQPTPSAPIRIVFEYFAHGNGDHFTVNSYTSTIPYDDIPLFQGVPLAWSYDFRPRINDAGNDFDSVVSLPKRGIDIESDYQHYLGRKDKVVLNQNGSFFNIKGTSSINPQEAIDSSTGMVLYKLNLDPYSYNTNSLDVQTIDNKRYTMRDIGKLEKRIDNIEYYTSLSLLEQEAQSLEIQDELGFNRFKNGFIVDNFTGHNVGDVNSQDYKCAIDMENGELRPTFYMDNVNLIEKNTSDDQRNVSNYRVSGDLVTLKYTEVEFIKQDDASRVENINPFAIFTFIGQAELNPPSDEWFETNRLPDVVTNVDGNFNAIYNVAERSGALSPVWNAWQTQWTGAPNITVGRFTTGSNWANTRALNQGFTQIGVAEAQARFGGAGGRGPARQIVAETTTTTVGQTRTGVRTVVVPKIDREVTDDRVLSRAVIPFIRARSLMFVVRGMKPNTLFTPFFDTVNIKSFVQQASEITINRNTVFSSTARAGGNSSEPARLVNGNSESALDRGDVVFVKQRGASIFTKDNSPATGVLALVVNPLNGTSTTLQLVNVKGSFAINDVVEGTVTLASSTVTGPIVTKQLGEDLISNSSGDVVGIFNIPNTDSNRFRTGTREFKLSDNVLDNAALRTSYVRKQYKADGILETKQASVTSTRNADLRQEAVNDTQAIVQTSERVISDTGWYDPLAQTFLVQSEGGAFVTSIDIYFATRDETVPARMQIREVVNGYPGKNILPFSEVVIEPRDVNISNTIIETSNGEFLPAPVPTNFKFESPVYLNDRTEYCIVLLSDSNNYKVWISQMGEQSVVKNKIISEQPYQGVLFKSQNSTTWTADQSQDLMFRIHKAKFDTTQVGEVDFVNASIPTYELRNNPLYLVNGTNFVRVTHENHGFFSGSKVTLSGISETIAGIPAIQFNATHIISSVEYDSYIIQVTSNATFTGNFGGSSVVASDNIQYNTVQPIVQHQMFPDTNVSYFLKTTTGKSVDGNETPYVSSFAFDAISINENNTLQEIKLIASSETEAEFMSGANSVTLRAQMMSDNENISPVIDISRLSLIAVQDRINSPSFVSMHNHNLDVRSIVASNNQISVIETHKFSTSDVTTREAFLTASVGKFITTTGFASASNNGTFLVTEVSNDGSYIKVEAILTNVAAGASVNINSNERFVSEIAPVGSSSIAKYVTKKVNLQNASTYLKIRFAADVQQSSDISLYYKVQGSSASNEFTSLPYTYANPTRTIVKSNNGIFSDVEYELKDLPEFTSVQVKLVMNSTSGSDIVRVRDLVIVGCA